MARSENGSVARFYLGHIVGIVGEGISSKIATVGLTHANRAILTRTLISCQRRRFARIQGLPEL